VFDAACHLRVRIVQEVGVVLVFSPILWMHVQLNGYLQSKDARAGNVSICEAV
jgi:hypothetical protein